MRIQRLFGNDDGGGTRRAPSGRRRMRGEKGFVLALVGMLILPLIAFTAFAVDLGSWYAQASRMQRAADAAALAGVVWTNDPILPTKWDTVARDTATRNGFTDGVNNVTVTTTKITKNQIKVSISSNGKQYFSRLFLPNGERLTRSAAAQYNLPIPLGSPRNYIGTAFMGKSTGAYAAEGVAASINGYCTDKVQGDQRASRYFNLTTSSSSPDACNGTSNGDYSANNYEYYIELPASRTQPVDVLLFDPQYDTSLTFASFPQDFNPGGQPQSAMNTQFTLFKADDTPLDDTNNPTMASQSAGNGCASTTAGINGTASFAAGATSASNSNYVFNPSSTKFNTVSTTANTSGWWQLCQIPTTAPAGKYILRVQNQTAATDRSMGSNNYSVVATYTTQALCDSTSDTTCPRVYGKDYLSLRAQGTSSTSDFYLAEIDASNVGKTLSVTLWDPGEGASSIGIQKPLTGTTWGNVSFTWQSDDGSTGGPTTTLDVSGSQYNGHLVTLTYSLAGYNPPANNDWWKIEYKTGGSAPTDRTTWAVNVLGDPVHLIQ